MSYLCLFCAFIFLLFNPHLTSVSSSCRTSVYVMIITIIVIIIVIKYICVYSISNLVQYKMRMSVISKDSLSGRVLLYDLFQFFLKLLFCFCLLDMRWNFPPFLDSPIVWTFLILELRVKWVCSTWSWLHNILSGR